MKEIPGQDARQGRKGIPVLKVLLWSLALALLVWVVAEIYGTSLSKQDNSFVNDNDVPVTTTPSKPPASAE